MVLIKPGLEGSPAAHDFHFNHGVLSKFLRALGGCRIDFWELAAGWVSLKVGVYEAKGSWRNMLSNREKTSGGVKKRHSGPGETRKPSELVSSNTGNAQI